jgi:transcriptional regulator with XRE-family HTH domain
VVVEGFGKRLRALREESGLTQRELAARVNTQLAQISRYEHDFYLPNAETLVQLARVLQVDLNTLLLGKSASDADKSAPLKNVVLLERLPDIDDLPRDDQAMLVRLIDALIKSRKAESVFAPAHRSA